MPDPTSNTQPWAWTSVILPEETWPIPFCDAIVSSRYDDNLGHLCGRPADVEGLATDGRWHQRCRSHVDGWPADHVRPIAPPGATTTPESSADPTPVDPVLQAVEDALRSIADVHNETSLKVLAAIATRAARHAIADEIEALRVSRWSGFPTNWNLAMDVAVRTVRGDTP